MPEFDNKDLVIIIVGILCIGLLFVPVTEISAGIIEKALYVLAGIAMGKTVAK